MSRQEISKDRGFRVHGGFEVFFFKDQRRDEAHVVMRQLSLRAVSTRGCRPTRGGRALPDHRDNCRLVTRGEPLGQRGLTDGKW